jgi:hypothetical protein
LIKSTIQSDSLLKEDARLKSEMPYAKPDKIEVELTMQEKRRCIKQT